MGVMILGWLGGCIVGAGVALLLIFNVPPDGDEYKDRLRLMGMLIGGILSGLINCAVNGFGWWIFVLGFLFPIAFLASVF